LSYDWKRTLAFGWPDFSLAKYESCIKCFLRSCPFPVLSDYFVLCKTELIIHILGSESWQDKEQDRNKGKNPASGQQIDFLELNNFLEHSICIETFLVFLNECKQVLKTGSRVFLPATEALAKLLLLTNIDREPRLGENQH
jgi:hypothetical protein